MQKQILIQCGKNWFEFSKSKTGQLDYVGKWEYENLPDVEGAQEFISSTFFSPVWYVFIQSQLNCNPTVYVAPDVDVSDKDLFDYLVHIGPVLAAVEAKDKAAAEAALRDATATISKATSKGVYHKNNCARKVSRLSRAVNSI